MSATGPDTVACHSCGTEIRLTASVCHNCGADNEERPGRSLSVTHDPSAVETTVSDAWYYGVAAGTGLWVVGLLLSGQFDSVAGFVLLAAWVGLPLSAYFDMQYVRANSQWNPSGLLWVVGLAMPLLNVVLGGVYLYWRHESLGVP